MIDATTQTATALAATFSGITMALLGVDHYALVYAFIGAAFALFESERMGRLRALVFVLLSTAGGAAMGSGLVVLSGTSSRALLIAGCVVCGFGLPAILSRLLRRGLHVIDSGKPPAPPLPTPPAGEPGGPTP